MIHCNVQAMEATEKSREASSQVKSPEQAPIEVSDDEQDEALLKLNGMSFESCRRWIPFSALRA
jgi:hypothetical protein